MPKKNEISVAIRAAIVAEYKCGISSKELAKKYNCHRNSIVYQVKKHLSNGILSNLPGRGRKRITSAKEDVLIARAVKINPTLSLKSIQNQFNTPPNHTISKTTVFRRLKEKGIKTYSTQKKPYISKKNKLHRLKFAREYIKKPLEFWRSILWTDESIFSLDGSWGPKYYRSTPKEKTKRMVIIPTRHTGGGNIMIWGCICYNGVGPLTMLRGKITQVRYLELLNEVGLVAGEKLIGTEFILQHDNAPIHKGKIVTDFLKTIEQNVLPWPAQSPDLNVIENIWAYMKREIPCEIGRTDEMTWNAVVDVWSQIDMDVIRNLIDSMPRRLKEVIEAKGGHTSY